MDVFLLVGFLIFVVVILTILDVLFCIEISKLRNTNDRWRTIETAPLDGTSILICHDEVGICEAWFQKGEQCQTEDGFEYDGDVWVCCDDNFESEVEINPDGTYYHGKVTHWKPLVRP